MSTYTVGYTEASGYRSLEDIDKTYPMRSCIPLTLAYCGEENCYPGWMFGPYIRSKYVIHFVNSGKGRFYVKGNIYELSEGQMFIIYPGLETKYQADSDDPWSYTWIGFSGYEASHVVKMMGFTEETPVLSVENMDDVSSAVHKILASRDLTMANRLRRTAAFMDILAMLIEQNRNSFVPQKYSQIKYVSMAAEMIANSYNKKLKIAEIADAVGVNRSYLSNIFKRELNMSPQEFLINFRLEKAAQMLKETEEPIGSIASTVGYTDALTFSKAFKQKYNMTPTEYRNSEPEMVLADSKGIYVGEL